MILKLGDMYSPHLGKFMYSLNNNLIPSSFSRSILRTNQVHGYSTRSSNRFYIPSCRTNRGTQRKFLDNICSEDDLRSRIFGTFVAKFLACLPLLGFSNI